MHRDVNDIQAKIILQKSACPNYFLFPTPLGFLTCILCFLWKHHVMLCSMTLPWQLEVGLHGKSAAAIQDP